jgi:hypothetical protein
LKPTSRTKGIRSFNGSIRGISEASRPDIALTYPWSTSFHQSQAFLDPRNMVMHNQATIDPDPSLLECVYLMSFLWVILGPMHKLQLDIGEKSQKTIFFDILINDQTDVGAIAQELDMAEGYYRSAEDHLIGAQTVCWVGCCTCTRLPCRGKNCQGSVASWFLCEVLYWISF